MLDFNHLGNGHICRARASETEASAQLGWALFRSDPGPSLLLAQRHLSSSSVNEFHLVWPSVLLWKLRQALSTAEGKVLALHYQKGEFYINLVFEDSGLFPAPWEEHRNSAGLLHYLRRCWKGKQNELTPKPSLKMYLLHDTIMFDNFISLRNSLFWKELARKKKTPWVFITWGL